ncbi:hypothetical protein TWF730_006929 [Orbilia blumenaviensis]|uniref:6-phosphofructo-2-kinase domain-containing protein n=1 Tax=Orbilia blumenaviensis TaxID=1796055 RepID=A0AAV9VFR3_9PEZI
MSHKASCGNQSAENLPTADLPKVPAAAVATAATATTTTTKKHHFHIPHFHSHSHPNSRSHSRPRSEVSISPPSSPTESTVSVKLLDSPELPPRPATVPVLPTVINNVPSIRVAKPDNTSSTSLSVASVPRNVVPSKPTGKHSEIAKAATIASTQAVAASTGNKDMLLPASIQNATPTNGTVNGSLSPMKSSDTPMASTPSSPRLHATTLNIPGLTKSKVSEDGRIPARDIGSKLVIVMVGLPARGKSYITRKLARYLGWLQYDVKVFNVGNRRRIAANQPQPPTPPEHGSHDVVHQAVQVLRDVKLDQDGTVKQPFRGTGLLGSLDIKAGSPPKFSLDAGNVAFQTTNLDGPHEDANEKDEGISQSAEFFDPTNVKAKNLRERVAMETLDEVLDYVMNGEGSIAILDATNSTIERRTAIVDHIREVAGNDLGILFIESICEDEQVLEANMRLKLSGPDYKGLDPEKSYNDFKKRVKMYEGAYVPIGAYEEKKGWAYLKLIDVGRKFVAHGIRGFLANHSAYYLMNFNLASRQIWITRHGESMDNVQGRIGGDSSLSGKGDKYAKALTRFIQDQRKLFHAHEIEKHCAAQLPPRAGNITPPNPDATMHFDDDFPAEKPFCVWTSMLKRSVETGKYFNDEEYDIKQWRMLDELNAGVAEGKTYDEIRRDLPGEYENRIADKLHYRYPGPGGESYLDVIHRLKEIIIEVERTTDHVLIVAHRVVARVLLGYYTGQPRDKVANLDVPLGMVFGLEPRPYGVELKAFKYDLATDQFYHIPDFELRTTTPEKSEREAME